MNFHECYSNSFGLVTTLSISNREFKDDGFGETVMSQWSNLVMSMVYGFYKYRLIIHIYKVMLKVIFEKFSTDVRYIYTEYDINRSSL